MKKRLFLNQFFFTFLLFFPFTASSLLMEENLKIEKKLNPVLEFQSFKDKIKNVPIQVVAPASGLASWEKEIFSTQNELLLLIPDNLSGKSIPYNSSSDEIRFKLLKKALLSEETIIWALRGGYGSARLFDSLQKMQKPDTQKVFIGYSDMTFLHLFFTQNWGWKTIHGAMLAELLNNDKNPNNFTKILDILSPHTESVTYSEVVPYNKMAKNCGKVEGILTGGNLEILNNSLGTPWQIQGAGKVIFIEDINAQGSHVDRKLNHLQQASVFQNAKAVVFGAFTKGDAYVDFALKRFAKDIKIPVFKSNQFGHGYSNFPLVFNTKVALNPTENSMSLLLGGEFKNSLGKKTEITLSKN